jgi:hypothetical protein
MTTTEEYLTMLAEARAALHKLLTGKEVSIVNYDGQSVQYSPRLLGHVDLLRGYIKELEVLSGEKAGRTKAILPRF